MRDGAQFARGEVVPQAVAAQQHRVAHLELVVAGQRDRRILVGAQAADQQVAVRVVVGFFFADLALLDQALHQRVVEGAAQHLRTPEHVDPRIARMDDVAFAARQQQAGGDGAVRLLLGGDGGQLDQQVRLLDQLAQQVGGVVLAGHEAFEQLLGDQQHLIGRLAATALAAHAVGEYREQTAGHTWVGEDLDLILLIESVAPVDAGGGR